MGVSGLCVSDVGAGRCWYVCGHRSVSGGMDITDCRPVERAPRSRQSCDFVATAASLDSEVRQ